jgi:hypothetical protein
MLMNIKNTPMPIRLLAALGALALVAIAVIAINASTGASADSDQAQRDVPTAALNAAKGLTKTETGSLANAPSVAASFDDGVPLDQVQALQERIPLPPGADSYTRVNWKGMPAVSREDVLLMLQTNAVCDWYKYLSANGASGNAVDVAGTLPNWPAYRTNPGMHQMLTDVAADLSEGGVALAQQFVDTNCPK